MKTNRLLPVIVAVLSVFLAFKVGYARLTGGSTSDNDAGCWGASGVEVCVDSSGNVVPTTASDTTVGSVALPFATVITDDLTVNDDLTVTDDLNVTGLATVGETLGVTGALSANGGFQAGNGQADAFDIDSGTITVPGTYGVVLTTATGAGSTVILSIDGLTQRVGVNMASPTVPLDVTGAIKGSTSINAGTTLTAGTNITATAGFIQLYSRSQAQIEALTPAAVGQVYFCNDCTLTAVCVSTGTAVSAFASVGALATDCD